MTSPLRDLCVSVCSAFIFFQLNVRLDGDR